MANEVCQAGQIKHHGLVRVKNQKYEDIRFIYCRIRSVYFVTVSFQIRVNISLLSIPRLGRDSSRAAGAGVAWPVAAVAREAESSEGSQRQSVGRPAETQTADTMGCKQ